MRIPSQFNDSSLYRPRRGEKNAANRPVVPARNDSRRRLIRLAVALALVVVVMREARHPGVYQTFFNTPQSDWVAVDDQPFNSVVSANAVKEDPMGDGDQNNSSDFGGNLSANGVFIPPWISARRWVQSMDIELQRGWIQSLIRVQQQAEDSRSNRIAKSNEAENGKVEEVKGAKRGQWSGLSEGQITDSIERLETIANLSQLDRVDQIVTASDTLRNAAEQGDFSPGLWSEIRWWANPMLDALDQEALLRVTDGTFWTGPDSDAFYLQLARASELDLGERNSVVTGTLPLLQQPEVYQGQQVRIVGTLQLAQRLDAKANRVGIEQYWKLWVIPADGGIRPTIFMTESLPEAVTESLTKDGKWDRTRNRSNPDGQIAAVGRFLKRLPYRSSIGADLAPVVVGRVVATQGLVTQGHERSTGESSGHAAQDVGEIGTPIEGNPGWVGILVAVLAGVLLAVGLMYRTSIDAKRSRQLRMRAPERPILPNTTLPNTTLESSTFADPEETVDGQTKGGST